MKIRFCMLENKKEILNYENYIESVSKKLQNDFYADLKYNIEAFWDDEVEVDNSSYIRVDYELGEEIIECFFEFQTFKTLELSVSLASENYSLENFKMNLKRTLINRTGKNDYDWNKCIWIYDSESENYSKRLYQEIHTMENLLREFIYDVLNKNLGSTWFEDISPYEVSITATKKKGSYKLIAPSFRDVDDSLMSINTGDLYKIMKAKVLKWNRTDENEILKILSSGRKPNILDKLYELLLKQTEIKIDIWNEYFAELLPTTFEDNFKKFESNRNHVAHNKHLDHNSFSVIIQNIEDLKDDIVKAYDLFYAKYKSKEYIEYISKKDDLLREIQEQIELEFMQSDSGVRIDDEETILEEMDNCIYKLIEEFNDNIADRNDLDFSEFTGLIINQTASIYEIKSKIDNSKIEILGDSIIDSSPGGESQIRLKVVGKENYNLGSISYQNGSCYFDEEQSTYLPEVESGWSANEFDTVLTELLNIVDKNIPNYKQHVDEKKINSEDILDTECEFCGEKYVYVGDDLTEYGLCLNCLEIAEFE